MISLNQCCAVCTNCSDSLRMARFHYMSPSSLLSFFPSFFLSLFLPLFSGLVSNKNEVYTVTICVGISVQLCKFLKANLIQIRQRDGGLRDVLSPRVLWEGKGRIQQDQQMPK